MKELLGNIYRNQFLRNVSTLAMGTVISQAVVVLSSPLLTRLFSKEDFGVLSVFTSITVFFAVISTGRYELAVGLPEIEKKAKHLLVLIFRIGLFVSVAYLLMIIVLKNGFDYHDRTGFLAGSTSYFAPLYIFFVAIYSGVGYWLQREKKYKRITIANAIQVISATIFSIGFGFLQVSAGMIYALILGIITAVFYVFIKEKPLQKLDFFHAPVLTLAKEYKSFPRYMTFSDLSLTASQQFIPVLFAALYSTGIVGLFAMANKMLRLPNIVITSSIGNVFRNDAIDEIRDHGNCVRLYRSTLKKLLLMSVPTYLVLFLISPYAFQFVFGEDWYQAGVFARIISLFLFLEFIATPLNTLYYVREKQKILMRLQTLNAVLGAIMIILGAKIFKEASWSLILYSVNALIFNMIFLWGSYKIAKMKI